MSLTVADIDRWSAESVRQVFHAAGARAHVTFTVSAELGSLGVFATWGGHGAEAAAHANATIRQDLDAHGNEALAVARAADRAVDGIEHVQNKLRRLRADAAQLQREVNPVTNRLESLPGAQHQPADAATTTALQTRLDSIIAEANTVDGELATAINMADGDRPIPDVGPPVGPEGLTPTQLASDANQVTLIEERARTQADVDNMQKRYDELAVRAYLGDHSEASWDEMNALGAQLTAARSRLAELDAVTDGLSRAPETYLPMLDIPPDYAAPVHAAIAVGNPDTASNVTVIVPGVGSTTRGTLPGMVTEASNLRDTAQKQLDRLGLPGSVATIAWMGYDPPANPINTISPRDLWRTMTDDRAQAGARDLAAFLQRVSETSRASNPGAHVNLFGHSYGSLTASLALQQLHQQGLHIVDDAVFYGSPGLEISSRSQLGLADGHAYVMRAHGDFITELAPLAPAHGWGVDPYTAGMPELSSQAGVGQDGVARSGVTNHSGYPRADIGPDGGPVLSMAGYNLAVIAGGVADLPGGGQQLMMAPTPLNPRAHPGG